MSTAPTTGATTVTGTGTTRAPAGSTPGSTATPTTAGAGTGTGGATDLPAVPAGWVPEQVSFTAGGVTVHGTYLHPARTSSPMPAAVLIAGSGPTDRNGNNPLDPGPVDTLEFLARTLADDGVASLRYDKLGTGATGPGSFAAHPDTVGIEPFTQEAQAAVRFVATRPGVDPHRVSIYGHSEGALFALIVATTPAAGVPAIHSLGLLEPLSTRYLDVITVQVTAQVHQQQASGLISQTIATQALAQLHAAVSQLRAKGTVPPDLGFGLQNLFNAGTLRFLRQADAIDPAALAAKLPHGTPVMLTCSDADIQVSCAEVAHLAAAIPSRELDFVHLHGVDHVLKQDDSRTAADYGKDLPFSRELVAALKGFTRR